MLFPPVPPRIVERRQLAASGIGRFGRGVLEVVAALAGEGEV
jgi:hypothetical protein